VFPEQAEERTVPAQQCLRLNEGKRLFPGPNHSGKNHQEQPVSLPVNGPFDLSMQDDQLLPQQGMFRQQFSSPSGQISECSEHKGSRWWFEPMQNTFLEECR